MRSYKYDIMEKKKKVGTLHTTVADEMATRYARDIAKGFSFKLAQEVDADIRAKARRKRDELRKQVGRPRPKNETKKKQTTKEKGPRKKTTKKKGKK